MSSARFSLSNLSIKHRLPLLIGTLLLGSYCSLQLDSLSRSKGVGARSRARALAEPDSATSESLAAIDWQPREQDLHDGKRPGDQSLTKFSLLRGPPA